MIFDELRKIQGQFGYLPADQLKNLANKIYPGSGTTNLLEGQLELKPWSNFDVWVKVQNFAENLAATYGVNPDQYPIFPKNTPFGDFANCPTQNGVDYNCLTPAPADLLPPASNPEIKNPWVVNDNVSGYVKERNDWTYTTHVDWDLPGVNVEYVGGWSQYDYLYNSDLDGTPSTNSGALWIAA